MKEQPLQQFIDQLSLCSSTQMDSNSISHSTSDSSDSDSEHDIYDNTEINTFIDTSNWKFKYKKNQQANFFSLYKVRSAQWVGDRKHIKNQEVLKSVKQIYQGSSRKTKFNYIAELFDFAKDTYDYTKEVKSQEQSYYQQKNQLQSQPQQQKKLLQQNTIKNKEIPYQTDRFKNQNQNTQKKMVFPLKSQIPFSLQNQIVKQKQQLKQKQKPLLTSTIPNQIKPSYNNLLNTNSKSTKFINSHHHIDKIYSQNKLTANKTEQFQQYLINNNIKNNNSNNNTNKNLHHFIEKQASHYHSVKKTKQNKTENILNVQKTQLNKKVGCTQYQNCEQQQQLKQNQNSQKFIPYSKSSSTQNLFSSKYFCPGQYSTNKNPLLKEKQIQIELCQSVEETNQSSKSQAQTPVMKQYQKTNRYTQQKLNNVLTKQNNLSKTSLADQFSESLNLSKDDINSPFLKHIQQNLSKNNMSIENSILTPYQIQNSKQNQNRNCNTKNNNNNTDNLSSYQNLMKYDKFLDKNLQKITNKILLQTKQQHNQSSKKNLFDNLNTDPFGK